MPQKIGNIFVSLISTYYFFTFKFMKAVYRIRHKVLRDVQSFSIHKVKSKVDVWVGSEMELLSE